MTTLVLDGRQRVLAVRSEQLAVLMGDEVVAVRAPERVEEVHVYGAARVTTAARTLCLRRGIDIVYLTPTGQHLGRLSSRHSAAGARRLAHLRAVLDPARRLDIARAVVAGKLHNQAVHLRRVQRRAPREEVADALSAVRGLARRAPEAADLDALRGVEGLGARLYFEALRHACHRDAFAFHGRNRRPPRDPINAALSFVYTLLVGRVHAAVQQAGLEPYVGFLHEATRGNPACALDLAEEWRPLVDALVFGLVNRRQLGPEDFHTPGVDLSTPPDGAPPAVHLDQVGREIVFRAWYRRLDDPVTVPAEGRRFRLADAMVCQAAHLARVVEGRTPAYLPFRWE